MYSTLTKILVFLLISLLLFFYFKDQNQSWKFYQKKWKNAQIEKYKKLYLKTKNTKYLKKINEIKNIKIEKKYIYAEKWNRFEFCISCHIGIEDISTSHPSSSFGCVVCHGGNPLSLNKNEAHKNLIGGRNPSDLKFVNLTCGSIAPDGTKCHADDIKRVKKSLMNTMAGVISDLRYQWNFQEKDKAVYATENIDKLKKIPFYKKSEVPPKYKGDYNISGEYADSYFRKKCSMCHIGVKNPNDISNHSSGCAACHVLYEKNSHYKGNDPTISKFEKGHFTYHRITKKIPVSQCIHCHNRSNRYGTSYIGIAENDFYGTPYVNGGLNPNTMIGGRFFYHLLEDIHSKNGMDCIDCHTEDEIMGDGNLYLKMADAVKIQCEDCHGGYKEKIKFYKINSISNNILRKNPNLKVGDEVIITKKGMLLYSTKREKEKVFLFTKRSNKKLEIKMITNNKNHLQNNCNKKLECYSCHFSWTMLCYGCHVGYNKNYPQRDFLTGIKTRGFWYEYRSYTRYTDIVLIKNHRHKFSPAQFCQSQVTVPEKKIFNKVFIHKDGTTSYVVAPVQPHTVTKYSKKCIDCHNNPMAVGIGRGEFKFIPNEIIQFEQLYQTRKAGLNIDFGFESVISPEGKQFQSVSSKSFDVLKRKEILKILRVGLCTPCHNSYNDKIYQNNNFKIYYNKIKKDNFNHIKQMLLRKKLTP